MVGVVLYSKNEVTDFRILQLKTLKGKEVTDFMNITLVESERLKCFCRKTFFCYDVSHSKNKVVGHTLSPFIDVVKIFFFDLVTPIVDSGWMDAQKYIEFFHGHNLWTFILMLFHKDNDL